VTAEIAIINRGAIVLAADSAVTLSVRGAEKIYTSAEKLFEFSLSDPIGIMIYNNLEFMGVPLDVIIKSFRDHQTINKRFSTLEDAAKAFFDYLESTVKANGNPPLKPMAIWRHNGTMKYCGQYCGGLGLNSMRPRPKL
jgi:hypothetical protein